MPVEAYPVLLLHTFNITGQTKQVKEVLPTFCAHSVEIWEGKLKKKNSHRKMYEKKGKIKGGVLP